MTNFNTLGFYTEKQILEILPISRSLFWELKKSGKIPKPKPTSFRKNLWLKEDIHNLAEQINRGEV